MRAHHTTLGICVLQFLCYLLQELQSARPDTRAQALREFSYWSYGFVEKGKKTRNPGFGHFLAVQGHSLLSALSFPNAVNLNTPKYREPKHTRPCDFLGLWLTVGKQTLIVCVCGGGQKQNSWCSTDIWWFTCFKATDHFLIPSSLHSIPACCWYSGQVSGLFRFSTFLSPLDHPWSSKLSVMVNILLLKQKQNQFYVWRVRVLAHSDAS